MIPLIPLIQGLLMKKATDVLVEKAKAALDTTLRVNDDRKMKLEESAAEEIMRQAMKKPFFRSVKWWTAIFAILTPVLNKVFGFGLDASEVAVIVGPMVAYIVGQGMADFGKNC